MVRTRWTAEEDVKLFIVVKVQGARHWKGIAVSVNSGHSARSCNTRYRLLTHPKSTLSLQDLVQLCKLVREVGHHWATLGKKMGKGPNSLKNAWNNMRRAGSIDADGECTTSGCSSDEQRQIRFH
jgi:hypothetical protein